MAQSGLARGLPCHGPTLPLTQEWEAGHRGHLTLTLRSKRVASHWSIGFPAPQSTQRTTSGCGKTRGLFPSPCHPRLPLPLPTRAALPWRMAWDGIANWSPPSCAQGDVSAFASDSTFATQCAGRALLHATVHARVSIKCVVVLCSVPFTASRGR